jgi:hypothetical protein
MNGDAPKWIPEHPNDFLEESHTRPTNDRPVDWETNYAPWRYCYAPGFRRLARAAVPDSNCVDVQKALAPYVSIAVMLVPQTLKDSIATVQKNTWTKLPPDQIRHAWDTANMGFAKIVLALVALQVLCFAKANGLDGLDNEGNLKDAEELFRQLVVAPNVGSPDVFKEVKIHLATYRFVQHDSAFWIREVVEHTTNADSFKEYTRFKPKFLKSFAQGDLATIRSLRLIREWFERNFPNRALGRIGYVDTEDGRVKAASKEKVKEQVTEPPLPE